MALKKLNFIKKSNGSHWVGDGFPVRNIFSYHDIAQEVSPFLMLDYAGPKEFPPTDEKRGVGEHPHRGFETVTLVYSGEVEHRDSSGAGGKIGPGDVQWMTAASGVVHEEFHGEEFAKKGGKFELVQLWVNLPAKDKMTKPRYQEITSKQIPKIILENDAGFVRVIAGHFNETSGPAKTYSPMSVWDAQINARNHTNFKVPEGYTTSILVLKGRIAFGADKNSIVSEAEMAVLDRNGSEFQFDVLEDSKLLIMSGQPLNEPIVGHGPFVMNTQDEIRQAIIDYQAGKMGHLR